MTNAFDHNELKSQTQIAAYADFLPSVKMHICAVRTTEVAGIRCDLHLIQA